LNTDECKVLVLPVHSREMRHISFLCRLLSFLSRQVSWETRRVSQDSDNLLVSGTVPLARYNSHLFLANSHHMYLPSHRCGHMQHLHIFTGQDHSSYSMLAQLRQLHFIKSGLWAGSPLRCTHEWQRASQQGQVCWRGATHMCAPKHEPACRLTKKDLHLY